MSFDMKPWFIDSSHRHEINFCGKSGDLSVGATLTPPHPPRMPRRFLLLKKSSFKTQSFNK
eukprot:1045176-Pelagomonas_calceolata.AAC.9